MRTISLKLLMPKPMAIWIVLSVLSCFPLQAETGRNTYRFLNLPYTAKLSSLGGENVSVMNNQAGQIYSNPALFTKELRNSISATYVNYLSDANGGMFSYTYTKDSLNYFGFNFLFLGYGDLEGYDENGNSTGEFSAGDFAWNLVYARYLGAGIKVGLAMKPIYSHIDTYSSAGLAFDVGFNFYKPEWKFSVGMVARNFGLRFKGYYADQGRERLPWNLQVGVSKGLAHAPFRFSLTYDHLNDWQLDYERVPGVNKTIKDVRFADMLFRHLIFGVEVLIGKSFHLDVAYNHRRNREFTLSDARVINGFSFGAGFRVYKFYLDAAYAQYAPKGGNFTLSLGTSIESFKKSK